MPHQHPGQAQYPKPSEIDAWIESLWRAAEDTPCACRALPEQGFSHSLGIRHNAGFQYIKFLPKDEVTFYGYWQPAVSSPAPLLVHVPGYGAEISTHPDLVAEGFNVLHISPMGYATPHGPDESKRRDNRWPVLPDTIRSGAREGYYTWLLHCLLAVRWAMQQPQVIPDRVSFFGTSQGGGGSLLLGSVFRGRGVRCVAADLPFLTNFPIALAHGAYQLVVEGLAELDDQAAAWRAIGFIDTMSHARRLDIPVLLTAGGADQTCPPETIEALFDVLPATRSFTFLSGVPHRYTVEFIPLAAAWFRLYA